MEWRHVLVVLGICAFGPVRSEDGFQVAAFHGDWVEGRSIRRSIHYSCTLPLNRRANYLAVDLRIDGGAHLQVETWGMDVIQEVQYPNGTTLTKYQTQGPAFPPRYVFHFHVDAFGALENSLVTCSWRKLQRPLVPVEEVEATTSFATYWTTGAEYNTYLDMDSEESCAFASASFVTYEALLVPPGPPGRPGPQVLPPRGSMFAPSADFMPANYTKALELSLWFYDAQRSGQLPIHPENSPIKWTKSSGLNHVTSDGRDLTGGWYNGNDAVKVTQTIAYSAALLQMGHDMWYEVYTKHGLEDKFVDTVKWALDYLDKCFDQDQGTLYIQVGSFQVDREIWDRFDSPAYQNLARNTYNVSVGSDVAADMATAYAMAALTSRNLSEANDYFQKAKSLYKFAKNNVGVAGVAEPNEEYPTYQSTDYSDDLCLAAVSIYRHSFKTTFLKQAKQHFANHVDSKADSTVFSWDNKYVACAVYLYGHTDEEGEEYQTYVKDFVNTWIEKPLNTEGFPLSENEDIKLAHAANAVFISLLAVEYGVFEDVKFDQTVVSWSAKVINHLLTWNKNAVSFMVGYSNSDIEYIFHKNSACPDTPATCGWEFYDSGLPNVNKLVGALMSGPIDNVPFVDSRANKDATRVMLDYNAGFTAALTGFTFPMIDPTNVAITTTEEVTTPFVDVTTTPLPTEPPVVPTVFNYSLALGKSILFYMAQRGDIPENYTIAWRKPTFSPSRILGAGSAGGWYDDGSSTQTTVAMSSTASLLSLGALKFSSGYEKSGQTDDFRETLRVAFDHLMGKCQPFDGNMVFFSYKESSEIPERALWRRPSERTRGRGFSPSPRMRSNEGANIVASTAAALVLGSEVFKEKEANFSAALLENAVQCYGHSLTLTEPFSDEDSLFYNNADDGEDEKCVAAVWLFKATGDASYISPYINSYVPLRQTELSWKNQHVLCQLFLYETTGQAKYKDAVEYFLRHWTVSGVQYTPQGLAWTNQDGPLAYSANAAFFALLAAEVGIMETKGRAWAKSQIDYMLGKNDNAFSYQIGYGDRYPLRPHHRASSCPDDMSPCDWSIYNSALPNPHVLIGALVGGPDVNDYFEDARTNYTMNRVAVDYNAGFQSALAGLIQSFSQTTTRPTSTTPKRQTTVQTTKLTPKTTKRQTTVQTTKSTPKTTTASTRKSTVVTKQPLKKQTTIATVTKPQVKPLTTTTTTRPTTPFLPQFGSTEQSVGGSSTSIASYICLTIAMTIYTLCMY